MWDFELPDQDQDACVSHPRIEADCSRSTTEVANPALWARCGAIPCTLSSGSHTGERDS